jgi:hypothetical protein
MGVAGSGMFTPGMNQPSTDSEGTAKVYDEPIFRYVRDVFQIFFKKKSIFVVTTAIALDHHVLLSSL